MARTVSRLYDTYGDAQRAVSALEAAGFSTSEIGMVSRYRDDETLADTASGKVTGAAAGAVVGGGAGLLAALGVIAIPGIGPLVAAGVLATTLVGAAGGSVVGGLIGALTDYGVSEEDAHLYSEAVRRGSSLVTVRTDDARAAKPKRSSTPTSQLVPVSAGRPMHLLAGRSTTHQRRVSPLRKSA
jgi:hypothetical protein